MQDKTKTLHISDDSGSTLEFCETSNKNDPFISCSIAPWQSSAIFENTEETRSFFRNALTALDQAQERSNQNKESKQVSGSHWQGHYCSLHGVTKEPCDCLIEKLARYCMEPTNEVIAEKQEDGTLQYDGKIYAEVKP